MEAPVPRNSAASDEISSKKKLIPTENPDAISICTTTNTGSRRRIEVRYQWSMAPRLSNQ
jgi:hypothetical protein